MQRRLQELVAVRLLVFGERGGTLATLQRDLAPCTGLAAGALEPAVDATLEELRAAGQATPDGKRWRATPEGARRALRFLGLPELPPATTWARVRDTFLAARALELAAPLSPKARRRIGTLGGLRAAILAKHEDLPVDEYPTLNEARDALAWKCLGRTSGEAFTATNVLTWLLGEKLGDGNRVQPAEALARLAIERVGAESARPAELRCATIRRWLGRPGGAPAPPLGRAGERAGRSTETGLSLQEFAARVARAARECDSGRFGDDKIFISHVWRVLARELGGDDLDAFKARLVEANRSGLLPLSRADMVQAMDPDDVRESETSHLNARFHFIRLR